MGGDETPDKKKMGGQDQYGKKWGDETLRQKTNGETRCKTKKMGLPDRDKKNGEIRRKTKKKWADKTGDKNKWGDETQDKKKMGRRDTRRKKNAGQKKSGVKQRDNQKWG